MTKGPNPKSLYLVEFTSQTTSEKFQKIGITGVGVKERMNYGSKKVTDRDSGLCLSEMLGKVMKGEKYLRDNPYIDKEILKVHYTYGLDAEIAEAELLAIVKPYQHWPEEKFSGHSECFIAPEMIEELKAWMMGDVERRNSIAPPYLKYCVTGLLIKERNPIKQHNAIIAKCLQDKILP